eukprot:4728311-Pyramimonas_sp.AAC.1
MRERLLFGRTVAVSWPLSIIEMLSLPGRTLRRWRQCGAPGGGAPGLLCPCLIIDKYLVFSSPRGPALRGRWMDSVPMGCNGLQPMVCTFAWVAMGCNQWVTTIFIALHGLHWVATNGLHEVEVSRVRSSYDEWDGWVAALLVICQRIWNIPLVARWLLLVESNLMHIKVQKLCWDIPGMNPAYPGRLRFSRMTMVACARMNNRRAR